MKLLGMVDSEEVGAMIDSGASHNFVSRRVVGKQGLRVDESVTLRVSQDEGCCVQCQGVCPNLRVDLGVRKLDIVGYLFELGGVDVILRVDWLRTLDEVNVDWRKMRMKFMKNGQEVYYKVTQQCKDLWYHFVQLLIQLS